MCRWGVGVSHVTPWLGGDVPEKSEIQGGLDSKAESCQSSNKCWLNDGDEKWGEDLQVLNKLPWCLGSGCCCHGRAARAIALPDSTLQGEVSSNHAPWELTRTGLGDYVRKGKLQSWPKNRLLKFFSDSNFKIWICIKTQIIWEECSAVLLLGCQGFDLGKSDCLFLKVGCSMTQLVS